MPSFIVLMLLICQVSLYRLFLEYHLLDNMIRFNNMVNFLWNGTHTFTSILVRITALLSLNLYVSEKLCLE